MTKQEALDFLQKYQPMPKDEDLSEELINRYEEVRLYFESNPDEQCIPLFLNSFGDKDGFGVYQMVESVMLQYSSEQVLPHILKALNSPCEGVRYWSIQIASNYPSEVLFKPLIELLAEEDEDIKSAVIIALAQLALNDICVDEIIRILKEEIDKMEDEDSRDFVREILEDICCSR